jgi:hypothetical protein
VVTCLRKRNWKSPIFFKRIRVYNFGQECLPGEEALDWDSFNVV